MTPDQADEHPSQFTSYPHLTPSEFSQTCHHLANRYHLTLPRTQHPHPRRPWTLRLCTALNTGPFFAHDEPEYNTYLQIVRSLDVGGDDKGLAVGLGGLDFGGDDEGDKEMMDREENDKDCVQVRGTCCVYGVSAEAERGVCVGELGGGGRHRRACPIRDPFAPDVPGTVSVV